MDTLELFSLKGKTAVITGGCGHLGRAMTTALQDAGANVYVTGTSVDKFHRVFGQESFLHFVEIDIMNSDSIRNAFAQIAEKEGSIDILVNNAAQYAGIGKKSEDLTDEDWSQCVDGIAGSTYRCIREVIPHMKGGGSIVNIASMYGIVSPYMSVYTPPCESSLIPVSYSAGKASVIQMTRYFGAYLIERKIRVNAKNPSHRLGNPEDLSGALLFLASDASKYVVGQNIQVDGGWTIW